MSDALDLEHLHALRADIAAFRADVEIRMDGLDVRLTILDRKVGRLSRDLDDFVVTRAMKVTQNLDRLTARIEALEKRVLEGAPD